MKSLLCLVFLIGISLQFSCKKDKADSNNSDAKSDFVIEHPSGFAVHFQRNAASSNILDLPKKEDASALLQLVNRNFSKSKSEFITLMNFKLDIGDKYSYLIFEGYNKSTKFTSSFAYLIELNPGHQRAVFKSSKTRAKDNISGTKANNRDGDDEIVEANHTCTGSPCGCCYFIRSSGVIIGCGCKDGFVIGCPPYKIGQGCNHTMTSLDSDGDGIDDEEDECPTIPGPIYNNGCPIE